MDIRNVQKTGDMFYLYLPTKWCRKFNIDGTSKVGVRISKDGSLAIFPQAPKSKPIHLSLKTKGDVIESLHKLIVASYISPANSFKITLDKELDFTKILNQKNLVSVELVEIEGNEIICESSIQVSDPASLLITMVRKVRNLLLVLQKGTSKELVERYESEIDRSKLLIEKAVIGSFVNPSQTGDKTVELHFMSLISKELEGMVDHIITLEKPPVSYLKTISGILADLKDMLAETRKRLDMQASIAFSDKVEKLQGVKVSSVETYRKRRISRSLNSISEVLLDWAVVKEVEK